MPRLLALTVLFLRSVSSVEPDEASVDGLTAPLSCGLEEAVFYADQRASGVASLHESLAEKIPARRELCESFCSACSTESVPLFCAGFGDEDTFMCFSDASVESTDATTVDVSCAAVSDGTIHFDRTKTAQCGGMCSACGIEAAHGLAACSSVGHTIYDSCLPRAAPHAHADPWGRVPSKGPPPFDEEEVLHTMTFP